MQTDISHTQSNWMSRHKLDIAPFIFLIPALFFFFIYVVMPIFQSLQLSLYEWNGLYDGDGQSTASFIGPACHTLRRSCFYTSVVSGKEVELMAPEA